MKLLLTKQGRTGVETSFVQRVTEGVGNRQAEAKMKGRSPLGQTIPFLLPPQVDKAASINSAYHKWVYTYFGEWCTFVFFSPLTFRIWWRWTDFFSFNLWILALILDGSNVPSIPSEYKTGNSGTGEAKVWLRCDAPFGNIFKLFGDTRSQSHGHSFTTWLNSLIWFSIRLCTLQKN